MDIAPSPIPSRTQYVLEAVKHAILTGRLRPGQALVEAELAAQFGVSKTPVREALKTLAGRGLVVMSEYKGATVRTVDTAMAHAVYDVRLLLEPEALRRTVAARAGLEAAGAALERSDAADDPAGRSLANRDFHRALYLPCGNPLLTRMLDELRDQAALVSAVAWQAVPSWEQEAHEHREILARALGGDADGAGRALHDHIASFVRRAFPDRECPDGESLDGESLDGESPDRE
ncbi:GntR family transcriptional regulator [Streptomyces violaceusniger]|uniref:GntR family transcriptional regulator n=1 Tax=Streptomyces violaceusniger TaxID=68280 RepID=UPI003443C7CF